MALVCDQIGVRYVADGLFVLKDVALRLTPGEVVGVVGCSGSGKTTLLKCLASRISPEQGSVSLDPNQRVCLVDQLPEQQLFGQTVEEEVAFGPRNLGLAENEVQARVEEALGLVGFDAKRAQSASPFALSGGEQRRVAIAGMLALHPDYLLLDEPTAGLDAQGKAAIAQLVRALAHREVCVVIVSHDMDFLAEVVGRVVVVREGRIVADGPAQQILSDEDMLGRTGLELPLAARMSGRLARRGANLPAAITVDDFVSAVAQLAQRGDAS